MIAVTFALPQESQDFVRALRQTRTVDGWSFGTLGARELLVAHVGVGPESAASKVRSLLAAHRPEWLVSAGFAGGLDPRLGVGDLLVAENFSASHLVLRFRGSNKSYEKLAESQDPGAAPANPRIYFGSLTSQARVIEAVEDKARLARETGALAVDMETAALAEACAEKGVPLLAIRVISDAAGDRLPVPMEHWFDLQRQCPRPLALLAYLARHPGRIAPFARFISGLGPARRGLTRLLVETLADAG